MLRIYLLYTFFAVLGWLCGLTASQWLSELNNLHWLRALFALGIGSLAIQQTIIIKQRLGEIESIVGLTITERSRLTGIIALLKSETLFGLIIVVVGNLLIILTAISNFNAHISTSFLLASFLSVTFFSIVLFFRMHWFLGNQIDSFQAKIKNRLEVQEKRKALLDKLQKND